MARPSEECRQRWTDVDTPIDDWDLAWILVREQLKVHAPDLVPEWDKIRNEPALASQNLGAAVDRVMGGIWGPRAWPDTIDEALLGHLPGFHNEDCTMNLEEFTCFAGWLASLDYGTQQAVLARMSAGETPWETGGYPCPDSVKNDLKYGFSTQKTPDWSGLMLVALLGASLFGLFLARK